MPVYSILLCQPKKDSLQRRKWKFLKQKLLFKTSHPLNEFYTMILNFITSNLFGLHNTIISEHMLMKDSDSDPLSFSVAHFSPEENAWYTYESLF